MLKSNFCVCCGNEIPEGTWTCYACENAGKEETKPFLEMVYKEKFYKEPQILRSGVYKQHKFAIISWGTHPVAYVEDKNNHFSSYLDEDALNIDVHGGFTYYGAAYWDKKDTKTRFLGWDYAHYEDYVGHGCVLNLLGGDVGRKWTTAEIYVEVISVIEQLISIGD